MLCLRSLVLSFAVALVLVPTGTRAQGGAEPYKIGITVPQTGPLAGNTPDFMAAFELAVADVNKAGGVKGHPLQLVVEDSQGSPQGGIAAMRKLVQVDGVQAIVTFFTNIVTAQMPLADELKVPTLSPVESPGLVTRSQYSFAHSSSLSGSGPILQAYWKKANYKKIVAIYGDNGFGHLIAPTVKELITGSGASYDETFIAMDQADFRGPLARVKDINPDAIYITAQGGAAETSAMRQIRELGMTTPIFNGSNFFENKQYHAAIGPYSEGMYFVGLALDPVASKAFSAAFRAKSGNNPSYQTGELYDMIKIFAWAIGKAGYNGPAIREAVASLHGEVPSILGGTITMGRDHYTQTAGMSLFQVKRGVEVKVPTPKT
jgi:branched-chain amino acid transport system substrate-binding protein